MANCSLHNRNPFEYWSDFLRQIPAAKGDSPATGIQSLPAAGSSSNLPTSLKTSGLACSSIARSKIENRPSSRLFRGLTDELLH
jgi:hypothetical protein